MKLGRLGNLGNLTAPSLNSLISLISLKAAQTSVQSLNPTGKIILPKTLDKPLFLLYICTVSSVLEQVAKPNMGL